MAKICLDRISRTESNLIIDSILTYYTDMSDRYTQNDGTYSFTTVSGRQIQSDDNRSPTIMTNSITVGEIGDFPLPPHTVHAAHCEWLTTKPQDMVTNPLYKAKDDLHKTPGNSRLPGSVEGNVSESKLTTAAGHTQDSDSCSKAQQMSPHLPRTEEPKFAISKPNHSFHLAANEEYRQLTVELPATNTRGPESHLRGEVSTFNSFEKKSIIRKHELGRRRNFDSAQEYGKGSLLAAENKGLMTNFPGNQQTLSYDGSVSSIGQFQCGPDSFGFRSEDTVKTRQNQTLPPEQKHHLTLSVSALFNHEEPLRPSIRQEGTSWHIAKDPSEHATSSVLHPYDLSPGQSSKRQITYVNNAMPPYMPSFPFKPGSLNLNPSSPGDSVPTFSHRPPEIPSSNVCNLGGPDRSGFRFSQDLQFQPSSQSRTELIVPDHIGSTEVSCERLPLLEQDRSTEEIYRNQDTCVRTTEPVSHHGLLTELQNQISSHSGVSIARRHATALLLSPQPQRLFSPSFYRQGSEIDLFEEHLKQEPRIEDANESLPSTSEENDVLCTSQNDVQQNEGAKSTYLNSSNKSNTVHNAKVAWPLPSYRTNQDSIRQKSYTQPSHTSPWQWDVCKHSDLQPSSNDKRLPALPKQTTHKDKIDLANESIRSLGAQEAIEKLAVIQATAISRSRFDFEPRSVHTLRRQKSLPELPEDLDTSAIATFPLSREVPLPEFVTAGPVDRRRTHKIASSLTSLPFTKQPSRIPILSVRGVKSVSVQIEQCSTITDEEPPLLMTNNILPLEQDVRDTCVVNSDDPDTDSHGHQYRRNTSSQEATANALPADPVLELLKIKQKRKQKVLKGCGPPWTRLWHSLSCSAPERGIIVSKSSTKTL